eukprot:TRINITY_DN13494_c1_g1_i1.p1 TRINITY_DN13494_c1_g1~~TRINITY_DN13494_c1_g1_i1.p1  ORF type:complete len:293 (-),score=90.85 TRINITY_DN13494_c1_g1_i1:163-1002(-)
MGDAAVIVSEFLRDAPSGEFMEVVTDVRTLLGNDDLLNSVAPQSFREYNLDQMIVVDTPKGKALVSKFNEVAGGEYLDPANGQVFGFDHIKGTVSGSRAIGGELDGEIEPFRKALEGAAQAYRDEHYPNGGVGVFSSREGGQFVVTVALSSALFNPKNFWGGRWRSVWTIKFKPGGGNADVKGNLRIQVHYYEEGNVQLNTNTEKSKQVPVTDAASFAQAVFKTIAAVENDFHAALDKSYGTMGNTTFKALRRALPITRKKIEWDKITQYKIGGDLGGK